ncbi:hypothetical protein [Actinoplanes sp. L3-i22]|nr:hypothetical protein [Actinoplanes sp. L3-i22]
MGDAVTLHLFRLAGDRYTEYASGERLAGTEPFPFEIDAEALLRRR